MDPERFGGTTGPVKKKPGKGSIRELSLVDQCHSRLPWELLFVFKPYALCNMHGSS